MFRIAFSLSMCLQYIALLWEFPVLGVSMVYPSKAIKAEDGWETEESFNDYGLGLGSDKKVQWPQAHLSSSEGASVFT